MRISSKIDYALRAMAELAASQDDKPVKAEHISRRQDIPLKFLLAILNELRRGHLVRSQRGQEGGYVLAREPSEITLADVMRAVEGPLANVHDDSLRDITYPGAASCLTDVWKAVRSSLRSVLESTSVADLATGKLPRRVQTLASQYEETEKERPRGSR
ncbi:MAG: Rrf2 family transcriptional regulator [Actinomycetota bacterium]